ncbi:MAG: flagellar biosynthesis repressor FlbT [Proteobacteria bacterium]|nr:flagellar biosynthesis repressor FlbT [Pseudomonadota bacterium]
MIIHLKKNEKLFINGAVIKLDRRGSIELLNDAQFLLASHVMQPEEASTPLRQLYFITQTMLIDPANSELTKCVFSANLAQLRRVATSKEYHALLDDIEKKVNDAEYYEALKCLRREFQIDDRILSSAPAEVPHPQSERAA